MKKKNPVQAARKPKCSGIKNQIWIYRKRMGYSQKDLARLLGNTRAAHISDYEHGKRLPNLKTALSLEIALCVPVAFLYRDLSMKLKEEIQRRRESLPTT